ncbi:hypothetical protein ABTY96_30305 [Streptomyces sp. NPDC096057]|uniref:hypothetical protein n=1 Tax=Streptomyces sp. NPDC096057 TaxID=3155543 RepID=UPI0033327941
MASIRNFGGIHQELKDTVHAWCPRPGGWQTLRFDHGLWEYEYLSGLVGWTTAPACVADVADSGIALLTGLGTDGQRWRAWLNLDNAAALLTEEPEDLDDVSLWVGTPEFTEAVRHKRAELDEDVPAAAEEALLWAATAGIPTTAQQPRIEELLRSQETFVEDLFRKLLDELGLPRAAQLLPDS